MKKILTITVVICMCIFSCITGNAQENMDINYKEDNSYEEVYSIKDAIPANSYVPADEAFQRPTPISDYTKNPNNYSSKNCLKISSKEMSELKQKNADAYLYTTGEKIGYVTLYYKTQILGGRPQFVFEETYFQCHFDSDYAISDPTINFSGDLITFIFPLCQLGILYDKTTVSFTP